MTSDADQLARLRVAAVSGKLPSDLGRWTVEFVEKALLSPAERRSQRDALLRQAAALVDGSTWRKAGIISEIVETFRRYPGIAKRGVLGVGTPAEYVQRAWRIDPNLPRWRRLLNVLPD